LSPPDLRLRLRELLKRTQARPERRLVTAMD
jgi:hypothetical protein